MTPSDIVVYAGKGTKTANETAYSILSEIDRNSHRVVFADAGDIRRGTILKETKLVVIPGGEDRYYCEDLKGAGMDNLAWHARERALLAFCAGAYGSGDRINYHGGLPDEVIADRPLKLFQGTVYSIDQDYDHVYDGTPQTIFPARVRLKDNRQLDIYCHGGCAFHPDKGWEFGFYGGKLMAEGRYEKLPGKPVAIARINTPQGGLAYLSGVHFELPSAVVAGQLLGEKANFAPLLTALDAAEKNRRVLMRSVLSQCRIKVRHDPSPIEPLKKLIQLPIRQSLEMAPA